MIFDTRSSIFLAVCVGASCAAGAIGAESNLVERMKVAAPATISFAEVRFSKLLKKPLTVSGRLSFLGAGQLDRTVDTPYREHTEIRSSHVKSQREGEPARTFSLQRAPELRTLLHTFSALLTGDRADLARHFQVRESETNDGWTIELVPLDANLRRLRGITVFGVASTPRCFRVDTRDAATSVLLLGVAAEGLKSEKTLNTAEALIERCRSNPSRTNPV